MANYIIKNDYPSHSNAADVVVYYDHTRKAQKFMVSTPDMNMGCLYVSIEELNGESYKYPSEVVEGILSRTLPEEGEFIVLFTNRAMNAVHLVCQGNRI